MIEPVRVRDKRTGHTYTTSKAAYEKQAKHLDILAEHPAVDQDGRFLDPKPSVKATRKASAAPAKENSK